MYTTVIFQRYVFTSSERVFWSLARRSKTDKTASYTGDLPWSSTLTDLHPEAIGSIYKRPSGKLCLTPAFGLFAAFGCLSLGTQW